MRNQEIINKIESLKNATLASVTDENIKATLAANFDKQIAEIIAKGERNEPKPVIKFESVEKQNTALETLSILSNNEPLVWTDFEFDNEIEKNPFIVKAKNAAVHLLIDETTQVYILPLIADLPADYKHTKNSKKKAACLIYQYAVGNEWKTLCFGFNVCSKWSLVELSEKVMQSKGKGICIYNNAELTTIEKETETDMDSPENTEF